MRSRRIVTAALAVVLTAWVSCHAAAQVLPERDACQPTTSARARDGNCTACATGPVSTSARFRDLVAQVRSRRAGFDDIDRRFDSASTDPAVQALLKGRVLAHALYGGDADFIAGGHVSRCLPTYDGAALARATAVACDAIPRDGLVVLLTAGQSNIGNFGAPDRAGGALYQPHTRFYNFNTLDGRCYVARNPLLGTPGIGENVAVRLGDVLIDRGLARHVVIVPVAVGGTYSEEWRARGGKYFELLLAAIAGLRDASLPLTAVLWHQGEYNAFAFTTSGAEDGTRLTVTPAMREAGRLSYMRNVLEIVAGLRAADVAAPIFVATATMCGSVPDPIIRSAQQSLPDAAQSIFAGPDTDTIGLDLRSDRCHMARAGTERHAEMWADVLTAALPPRR